MGSRRVGAALAAAFLVLAGCGGDGGGGGGGGNGSPTDMRIHGVVNELPETSGGDVSPLAGASIRATVDRDGDGRISGDETTTATADDQGKYSLALTVEAGETVVIRYASERSAPLFRTVRAGPRADVILNVGLRSLEPLTVAENGRFEVDSRELSIANLDTGLSGSARVFNPVVDAAAFPGGFGDSEGNLLISGVFSTVELTDGNGEVDDLETPAELRMKLPLDTWNIVVDILPGNDRIDVPMYAFDEVLGTWVREGEGHLEDGTGAILTESVLPSVRDGSFPGVIYSVAVVRHFSYWNVDWPVESHGCLTGRIVLENGTPAEGATVLVSGVTYNGSSTPFTVGPDGRFCLDVMRSETATDDVDQDGTPGETHRVKLRVAHGGKVYDAGVVDAPSAQGSCGEGGCADLGDFELDPARVLEAGLCAVTGRVLDRDGAPAAGATVWAWDETVPEEVFGALCSDFMTCMYFGTADDDGRFAVTGVAMDGLLLTAYHSGFEGDVQFTRWGERRTDGCPQAPVDVRLDAGMDFYTLAISADTDDIGWTPNVPVQVLTVNDAAGEPKWAVATDDEGPGFVGPVSYGVVPPGASQLFPWETGVAPEPMASGDSITVLGFGVTAEGYDFWASGEFIVP